MALGQLAIHLGENKLYVRAHLIPNTEIVERLRVSEFKGKFKRSARTRERMIFI